MNCFPFEAGDIGTRTNTALFHVVEEFAVDGGMRFEDTEIGIGEPVLRVLPNGDAQHELQKQALRPNWMPGSDHIHQRDAEKGLREEPIAAPKADGRALPDASGLRRDIAGRISATDDKDTLAGEL